MKKLLFLFCLIPSLVFAAGGGGAGVKVVSEAEHPLRHKANRLLTDTTAFTKHLSATDITVQQALETLDEIVATGAPTSVDYLIGTANALLSNAIVVGTTPEGDLGGTWASPSVDDDSHAHTGTTISGVDVSEDTNLSVNSPLDLTGDKIGISTATSTASGVVVTSDWNSWTNHVVDNSQAHSDYMLNSGDTGEGAYIFTGNLTLGDSSAATYTLTSALSGATDPILTFENGKITVSNDLGVLGDLYVTDVFVTNIDGDSYVLGNLGVGTATPAQKLDVLGIAKIASGLIVSSIYPPADAATAIQVTKADGVTSVININTTNSNITLSGLLTATGISVSNGTTASGIIIMKEDADYGNNKVEFNVPALANDITYTLPPADGAAGQQLTTNGSGSLSWGSRDIITAGRSLTRNTDDIVADSELYTDFKGSTIETPTDADNFFVFEAPIALTITRVQGIVENATSAVLTYQECDSAGDNCSTIESITADVDGTISTSIDNPSIDAGDIIRLDVGTVTGTVGQAHATITFTKDD